MSQGCNSVIHLLSVLLSSNWSIFGRLAQVGLDFLLVEQTARPANPQEDNLPSSSSETKTVPKLSRLALLLPPSLNPLYSDFHLFSAACNDTTRKIHITSSVSR